MSRTLRRVASKVAPFLLAAVVAAALGLAVTRSVSVSGPVLFGQVNVSGSAEPGVTRIAVPPAGTVEAATHSGPLGVAVRLDAVDLDRVETATVGRDELRSEVTDGVRAVAVDWLRRSAVLSAVIGAVIGLAVSALRSRRSLRHSAALVAVGAFAAASTVAGVALWAWQSFDSDAFSKPTYSGALKYAPSVLGAADAATSPLDSVSGAVEVISSRIEVLAAAAADAPGAGRERDGDVVLLHVSDLHLNPLGAQFVTQLADRFEPDAVIDTGDFTSFGVTDVEAVYSKLVDVDVPYYLTPGNHDSAEAAERLRSDDVVTIVDGDVVDIAGLSYTGVADPTFTPAGSHTDPDELREQYRRQHDTISELLARTDVDVIGLHNPSQAVATVGAPEPLTVLSGHTHTFWYERDRNVSVAVAATTGADGIGSFGRSEPGVYSAQLLRFRRDGDRFSLWSVDRIQVDETALLESGPGTFRVERIDLSATTPRYLPGEFAEEGPVITSEPAATPVEGTEFDTDVPAPGGG